MDEVPLLLHENIWEKWTGKQNTENLDTQSLRKITNCRNNRSLPITRTNMSFIEVGSWKILPRMFRNFWNKRNQVSSEFSCQVLLKWGQTFRKLTIWNQLSRDQRREKDWRKRYNYTEVSLRNFIFISIKQFSCLGLSTLESRGFTNNMLFWESENDHSYKKTSSFEKEWN